MPITRGRRKLVKVTTAGIEYGFLTTEIEAVLGHAEVTTVPNTGYVFGANSPKPARATKDVSGGTRSSWVGDGQIAAARAADWTVTNVFRRVATSTARSKAVFVTIGGIKYGWQMPISTYNGLAADRTVLGIEDATANDLLVFGASYPKPPRVVKKVAAGQSSPRTTYSTFVDPAALDNLPEGYQLVDSGRFPVAANPVT